MVNMKVFQLVYRLGDMEFEEMKKPFISLPKIENWLHKYYNLLLSIMYTSYTVSPRIGRTSVPKKSHPI